MLFMFRDRDTRQVITRSHICVSGIPGNYQEAFLTPGILPANAISRKVTLEIPK